MAEDANQGTNLSVSVPFGALAAAAVIGLGAAAYLMYGREDTESAPEGSKPSKSGGGNMRRKVGLMTLIAIIENDTGRKLLLTVLKAMARRA